MNFLAHLFLAGPDADHRLGGLLGDFVKGPLVHSDLPRKILEGIVLHRAIDSYAETHDAFRRSKARVSANRRRYAGILVDMFYDHLLARDWDRYHPQTLSVYAVETYTLADDCRIPLPPRFARVFEHMKRDDWLSAYANPAHIGLAIDRMSEFRLSAPNPLAGGITELTADSEGFAADFKEFIADAKGFASTHLARLA